MSESLAENAARIGKLHALRSQLFLQTAHSLQAVAAELLAVASVEQTAAVAWAYSEDPAAAVPHGDRAHSAAAGFIGGLGKDLGSLAEALRRELATAEAVAGEGPR